MLFYGFIFLKVGAPMLKSFKLLLFLSLFAVISANAAPSFPFPQNKKYPHGYTFNAANTAKIQEAFNTWKGAWYTTTNDGLARIISPNDSTEYTVSEGIGYGMLLMVYMSSAQNDYQSEFDKLWGYWKKYAVTANQATGMNWKVNNNNGNVSSGSASDAEFDAALALIMAYKQWGNTTYLNDAKALISWIKNNDMNGDKTIRPGNAWNDAFNPSYAAPAAFKLFGEVTNDASYWNDAITVNNNKVKACQEARTGLMPDWCDWSTSKPKLTSANVSTGLVGFNYDAARTPWRMAWSYYWYGESSSKAVNDKIVPWLVPHTYASASYIRPGYVYENNAYTDIPGKFPKSLQSTYMGGLGLAMASADDPGNYVETIYEALINTKGKASPNTSIGEGYFSATLNVLYLLLLSGNMPNFYDMTSYTAFTPTALREPTPLTGTQVTPESKTPFCGFSVWGAFSDKLGTGTKMYPDSGSTPIFYDGAALSVKASLRIASEPEYGTPEASNKEYPFAGVVLGFDEDDNYYDLSDVAFIRVNIKTEGVIRLAILSKYTLDQDEEGGEPGYWFQPSSAFNQIDIPLSVKGTGKFDSIFTPSWVSAVGTASEYMSAVRGVKLEPKMQKGGYGSFELKEILFLNANKQPANIYTVLGISLKTIPSLTSSRNAHLSLYGSELHFSGFSNKATFTIIDLKGEKLYSSSLNKSSGIISLSELNLPKGISIVHVKDANQSTTIKIKQ
jgi:endo-1,4-beta-D-glucanase Y